MSAMAERWHRWRARGVPPPWQSPFVTAPPARRQRLAGVQLLALDVETTGLDPRRDRIVSAGWCVVADGALQLDACRSLRIASAHAVGDSALVHGLRDVDVAGGDSEAALLDALLPALAGRVLLAHGVAIEHGFLQALLRRHRVRAALPVPRVCTLTLESNLRRGLGEALPDGGLTLAACRERHGLPDASAHEALADAVACAELLLAQVQLLGGFDRVRLASL